MATTSTFWHTTKSPMKQALESSIDAISRHCDQIIDSAENSPDGPDGFFTRKGIRINIELCMNLARAIADVRSPAELRSAAKALDRMKNAVIAADCVLAERMTTNPHTISCIIRGEELLIDMLIHGEPFIITAARFITRIPIIVPLVLRAIFTDIQHQLAATARGREPLCVQLVQEQYETLKGRSRPRGRHPKFTPEQQNICHAIWTTGQENETVRSMSNARTSRENVFAFYRRELCAIGIKTPSDFKKALKSFDNRVST